MTTRAIATRVSGLGGLGALLLFGFVACGGSTAAIGADGSSGGTSGTSGGSGTDGGNDGADRHDDGPDASGSDGSFHTGRVPANHRATAVACSHDRGPGDSSGEMPFPGQCQKDADCTAGSNGRCFWSMGGARVTLCSYDQCFADSECAGKVCACRASSSDANACTEADCTVDADCGAGGYCSPSVAFDKINYPVSGYHCHTSADTCVDDLDCASSIAAAKCAFDPSTKHWACSSQGFYPPAAGGVGSSGGSSGSGGGK